MSRNYFTVELDTTSPQVEIYAPTYTVFDIPNYIQIVANEKLDNWQELYLIDSDGNKHDLIFNFDNDGDRLEGWVTFNTSMSAGIATLYARVRDEVHNISEVAMKAIKVSASLKLRVEIKAAESRVINTNAKSQVMHLNGGSARTINIKAESRKIKVGD